MMTSFPNDFEPVHRQSLSGYFTEVDNLTNDTGSTAYIGNLKDITRNHWKPIDGHPNCSFRGCRKAFSLLERPHHCRRCGEVFCTACLQYRRRLNRLAHFDLEGQLYKVCKTCFELNQISDGQLYSHTEEFKFHRSISRSRSETGLTSSYMSANTLENECDRLIRGFASSVGRSEIKRALHEMRRMVSTPDWMKSSIWVRANLADKCYLCQGTFGIMKAKKFCKICGLSMCANCSSKDLLIYFPDVDKEAKGLPRLAIIKIIGCPEVEPEVSTYLRVCSTCKEKMIDRQVVAAEEEAEALDIEASFPDLLHRLDLKFRKTEEGVKKHLPNYSDVVESLEDGSHSSRAESNTKTLAKAQGDLADALAHHVTNVQQLKKLTPKSEAQTRLLKNYIRAKCEFYMDNMCIYRSLKEKLSKSVPVESLEFIQRIMDKNAIISTHLYLRQLMYELLHLTDQYKLGNGLPDFFVRVEQEIEGDVRKCLILEKEDVDEHLELVKEMIRTRLKKHKLIRPSQKRYKEHGSRYISDFMLMRTGDIVSQVHNQLQLMSASRSFPKGKKALEMALEGVKERKKEAEEEQNDFQFV